MTNEQKKKVSKRQKIANTLNPLKHGRRSKTIPQNMIKYFKNPEEFKHLLAKTIDALENKDLDTKERLLYLNAINSTFRTLFGNRNLNLNIDLGPSSAKSMSEIYLEVTQENEIKANLPKRKRNTQTSNKD